MPHQRLSQTPDAANCWLALRYLSGDLDEAEWAAFEDRLAHDFALQAALAETVKLTTGISQIDGRKSFAPSDRPSQINRQTRQLRRSVGWPAVGTAAAAASLVALGLLLRTSSTDSLGVVESAAEESSRFVATTDVRTVVSLWSSLAEDETVADDPSAASEANSEESSPGEELDVPNWLLLAVRDDPEEPATPDLPRDESL